MIAGIRWAVPAAAAVYLAVLVRRLPDIVGQLTWNADYVSQMAIAQSVGASGVPTHAVVIQIGYFWFDLATLVLPWHIFVWLYAPAAMAVITVALIAWTAWRVAGRWAGVLAASLGAGASPLVLSTEVAQAYHGSTWFGTALLAAYAVWLLTTGAGRRWLIVVSVAVGLIVGFATASDPLLAPAADAPLAAAFLIAWRARPAQFGKRQIVPAFAMGLSALLTAAATVLTGRLLGFTSSFPRGLTHVVPREHLIGNLRQLVSGVFEVAGMPHSGSPLGVVLGLLLVAALLVPVLWLIRLPHNDAPAPLVALMAFWAASSAFVGAAFLFSDIPADFLDSSARYLISLFFVAVATVPAWCDARPLRSAAVAAPAVLMILSNAAAVDHAASIAAFEPPFGLTSTIAFLEEQHLDRGYAAYEEASTMSLKTDFALHVYPVTELFVTPSDTCGPPPKGAICPYAYNSESTWYTGSSGPTFILVDPALVRLSRPPPPELDVVAATYHIDRFTIFVYADDVASHMGTPQRFTRSLI